MNMNNEPHSVVISPITRFFNADLAIFFIKKRIKNFRSDLVGMFIAWLDHAFFCTLFEVQLCIVSAGWGSVDRGFGGRMGNVEVGLVPKCASFGCTGRFGCCVD